MRAIPKKEIVENVCKTLEIKEEWLDNLIEFESGWNPLAKNPYSGARGLIQFTNSTAKWLGYESADDLVEKNSDVNAQLLFPVLAYLSRFKPFKSEEDFYLSVFYPAARGKGLDYVFPDSVQKLNPNIKTVKDYVNKIKRVSLKKGVLLCLIILILIMLSKKIF